MRIVIAGAGTLGRRVANYTRGEHDVLVIEQSRARAHAVEEELEVQVLVGDADEPAVLYEAGVDRADVFVAEAEGETAGGEAEAGAEHFAGPEPEAAGKGRQ